ncbi:MAG TPA: SPFH domain-containing protein [Candidatus Binatia bacterium]|nr:SPFH domain-containing protein [Candidatus Binatia bacterium]
MPGFFPGARENIAVPDDRKGQIVFKWPDMNIRRFTHAIVAPDEVAVFMYQGQVKGTLPPGRHELDATEIPFLGIFADALTGGNLYRTELYFVGNREFTQNRFGGKIDSVQDPVSTLIVSLRVFGDYSLKVIEPASLLVNLVGTVDVTDNTAITNWVAEQLLKVLRTDVTSQIVRSGWPILGLAAYTPEIEKAVIELGNQQLASYGLTIARMGNFTISLDDESQKRLEQFSKDTAYSRLAGSFQQYAAGEMALGAGQGMAQGGGATAPAFLAAGIGLGGQMAQPYPAGPAPAPGPGFPGGAGGYGQPAPAPAQAPATVQCPQCHTANATGGRFCSSCGTPLTAAHCTGCGAELAQGARFCAGCGQAVGAAPGPAAPPSPPPAPAVS